jgi:hypothetical protein
MSAYFSGYAPNGDAVTLEIACYDNHIRFGKVGPALPSVFEIQAAVKDCQRIIQSAKENDSFFYVREVGQLSSRRFHTMVLARRDQDKRFFVSTAYNAERAEQKGKLVWEKKA